MSRASDVPVPRPVPVDPAVSELIARLLHVSGWIHTRIAAIAARHGLTPQQAKLLRSLDRPHPMSVLAEHLGCDPSNVTGLIDRIEHRGLVRRTPDPTDRRVKLLSLTAAGRRLRDETDSELVVEVVSVGALRDSDVERLLVLLDRVLPPGAGGGCGGTCG